MRRTGQAKKGERLCQRPRQTRKGALGWGRSLSANHQRARDEARGGLRDRELGALRDSAPREESTALPKVVRGPHLGTLGAVRWFPGVLHHGLRVCCRSTRCSTRLRARQKHARLYRCPSFFFSLTLRRRRRTSDKNFQLSNSEISAPAPRTFSENWFQIKTHTRIGAGILQQERLSTCHQERQRPQKSRKARDLGTDTSLEGSPASPKESKIGRA